MAEKDIPATLDEVMRRLDGIPFRPRPLGGRASTAAGFAADALPMLLDTRRATACRLYPYPRSFRSVTFPSLDGTPLAGRMALHADGRPRPGLVFCHGLFGSKNHNYIRSVAVKAHRDWGYNVLALDTRGFGESRYLSEAMVTGGWKEGEDVVAAARYLGSFSQVTSVGVSGYSMGAAAAMIAAGMDGGEHITGGVLAWNGTSDTRGMIAFISRAPKPWEPFFVAYPLFKACLVLKLSGWRGYENIRDFTSMLSAACEYYRLDEEEAYRKASPGSYVAGIRIPTVHIHAQDDPIVPVREAEMNREAAGDNPCFRVWILPRGGHCAFMAVDNAWYEGVLREFFGAWGS
ncbi:MAG: alpha/beta fold hydrolase [Actinobacteria bacterium]|nr:alpha/beta fold hydrolase [Actinomycetota bacterium]MDI6831665.1 alpha/beta fold hydrolase [Actinomycetota bacterium]